MTDKRVVMPRASLNGWEKAILAAILGLGGFDSHSKSEIAEQLRAIQHSVQEISTSLAVIASRVEEHERRLDRLEGDDSGRQRRSPK